MAISVSAWSAGVRRDREVRRAAGRVAWALADRPLFGRAGCRATDEEIASEISAASNTVKNSLIELRARGHLDWTWRRIRGADVRTIVPVLLAGQQIRPLAVAVSAPTVGADAEPEHADPCPLEEEPAECRPEEVPAGSTDERYETGRGDLWSRYGLFPDWPLKHQRVHVQRLVNRLPHGGWSALCSETGCQTPATYICADEGDTFCRTHRRYAGHRVPLAAFGLGPESYHCRPQDDGDFRGW